MNGTASRPAIERQGLRPGEVALSVGISEKAIYSAIHSGELRAARIGGRWIVTPAAVDAWLAARSS